MEEGAFFWLGPLLPLAAFAVLAAGLSRFGRLAAGLAIAGVAGALLILTAAFAAVARGAWIGVALPWLRVGGRRFELALLLDPLSAVLALLVAAVATVVFIYAAAYLAPDARRGRFFAELSLFAGAMLALVLAGDLLTLFIAWELVGLCSYLLIGFWFERPGVAEAASKALLVTRLGDLALLLGLLLLVAATGTSRLDAALAAGPGLGASLRLTVTLLLFAGAASKSAQVPFQGWLPDAMAGPAPVSALLHSATMVAAGVVLVARLYPLFLATPLALLVVAWTGAATTILGAAAALVQPDLKRLLAYSTLSQLGLMYVGLGTGSLVAGVLLLIAQAFYKALLFLAAGAVEHAAGGTTFDVMGGLARRMPLTFIAFAIGAASLAGLPVTAALPPKDAALAAAGQAGGALLAVALLASLGTALYSSRALALAFLGPASPPALKAREAPPGLLVPMIALAGLVILGPLADSSLLGRPLERLLGEQTPEAGAATALSLALTALGLAGGLWARRVWPELLIWPPLRPVAGVLTRELGLVPAYRIIASFGLQAASAAARLDRAVFDPLGERSAASALWLITLAATVDRVVFDAFAGGAAGALRRAIGTAAQFDAGRLEAAIGAAGQALLAASQRVRRLQTGHIEHYLLAVYLWLLAGVLLAAFSTVVWGRGH